MMGFLRLGVECAVLNDDGHLLLSRRGDLNVWNLPGGRVDAGERLEQAAVREVREETGVIVQIERAVGLYYLSGWKRLNVAYAGWSLGGELLPQTLETTANTFFDPDQLPDMPWNITALDALAETRHQPRIIETSPDEMRRVKTQLRWRWAKNLLKGRPEPRFPQFDVQAVGLVWDDMHQRVVTLPGEYGRVLPRVRCDGSLAPWIQLTEKIREQTSLKTCFRWVGLWQDTTEDSIEFVFAATLEESELMGEAEWSAARNAALHGLDAVYAERVQPHYQRESVWSLDDRAANREMFTLINGQVSYPK